MLNERDCRFFVGDIAIQAVLGLSVFSIRVQGAVFTIYQGIAELTSQGALDDEHIKCSGVGHRSTEKIYPDIISSVQR